MSTLNWLLVAVLVLFTVSTLFNRYTARLTKWQAKLYAAMRDSDYKTLEYLCKHVPRFFFGTKDSDWNKKS